MTNSQRKKYKQKQQMLFQFAFFIGDINKRSRSIVFALIRASLAMFAGKNLTHFIDNSSNGQDSLYQ
jgi:hypothetical protein